MTAVVDRVGALVHRGVQLWPNGSDLQFSAPPGALSADDRAFLREHKVDVLRLLDGRRVTPLSETQERLWFLTQLDRSGVGYLFGSSYQIDGLSDVTAFTSAVSAAVTRHDAMRASFEDLGGAPVQFVEAGMELTVPVIDCRDLAPSGLQERMRSELMAAGPAMVRSALFRIGEASYVWTLVLHHLVADGRTFRIIVDGLSDHLSGVVTDEVLGFSNFLEWDRIRDGCDRADEALRYWTECLEGFEDVDLILDHPRPPVRGYAGGQLDLRMPAALVESLDEFARRSSATQFSTLLAVYFALLSIYTDTNDLTVGVPHVNRPDPRFDRTAGCFVSTQVLRLQLAGEASLADLVAEVTETSARAWESRDYSFEQLVARLRPDRDISRNALFSTFFAGQEPNAELRVPGAQATALPFETGIVQFDLELHITPAADGGLVVSVMYNRDLFERASVDAFGQRFIELVRSAVAEPHVPVRQLRLKSGDEATALANDTATAFDLGVRVDELIRCAADRDPDRVVVISANQQLTYRNLMSRVDALAARLGELNVSRIGIALNRGPDMVVAVLAAMVSGVAFVPLDPALPAQRLVWMIEDCALSYAISEPDVALPAGIRPVPVEGAHVTGIAETRRSANEPAYVLFTSGSTGRPKGVEVSHRNLTNLICSMLTLPGVQAKDVFVSVTSLSFDISILEILAPLVVGAPLVVATRREATDPALLASLLDAHHATVMQATPSQWQMLIDSGWAGRATLTAWCGGEALNRDLADQILGRCAAVWNLYGPTETTIWSTRWQVERGSPVLLGRPIENTRCYVINSSGIPVPAGVPGELYLAGAGVATGYVGRPEETARRFVDVQIEPNVIEHAYRTGDLVRQRHDGSLVYLGRTDLQIKVRGHRIEPEEVEHVLRACPGVRDAVVTLSPNGALIGHLRAEPDGHVDVESVRAQATSALPSQQVPQHFVVREDFPATANGKIDRKALAAHVPAVTSEPGRAPADDVEEFVAGLFQELLDVELVSRDSDFFELGGHSLLAPRLIFHLEQEYGVRIPMQELVSQRTVAGLASAVRAENIRADERTSALDDAFDIVDSMSDQEINALLAN